MSLAYGVGMWLATVYPSRIKEFRCAMQWTAVGNRK